MPLSVFKKWMKLSTAREKKRLAKSVGTNFLYLYEISSGRRVCSSELAGRIELATRRMSKKSGYILPWVTRADLSPACRKCPHFKSCRI